MEHLFSVWHELRPALEQAGRLLVMLDFDGTLSPIVERSQDARILEEARAPLAALAEQPSVELAVITGRALADVRTKVGIEGIHYVGNHGRERLRSGTTQVERNESALGALRSVSRVLTEKLKGVPGAYIQDKGFTAALHFRQTPKSMHNQVRIAATAAAEQFKDQFEIAEGKCVFDITPKDNIDKGTAALDLLTWAGGPAETLAIFIGDDTTDETAFRALPAGAIKVLVGPPKETAACYRVDDPEQVAQLLARLAKLREASARKSR